MKLKYISIWCAASVCLVALLAVQRSMDFRLASTELHACAVAQMRQLAELFAQKLLLAKAETGGDFDEYVVRPVVFEMMEHRELAACGVYGQDRLLEAQMRKSDGSLAPLAVDSLSGHWQWSLSLQSGDETLGKVWVELDPNPWQQRLQKMSDTSVWYLVALSQAGAAVFFLGLLAVRRLGGKNEADEE